MAQGNNVPDIQHALVAEIHSAILELETKIKKNCAARRKFIHALIYFSTGTTETKTEEVLVRMNE